MDSPILAPWCGCKSADEAHAHLNHVAAALSGQHSLPAELPAFFADGSPMQSENPVIADFVKLMNNAVGTFAGMTREARESGRERIREALGGLDFVAREEFEAVKAMAAKAREDAEDLQARVEALEAKSKG